MYIGYSNSAFGEVTGEYRLDAGNLWVKCGGGEYIGYHNTNRPSGSTASFIQNGGTHRVEHNLTLGYRNLPTSVNACNTSTFTLNSGDLSVGGHEYIGFFDGGYSAITSSTTFNQSGGTLNVPTINHYAGGTVTGTLQNQGVFNYYSSIDFAGRLLTQGSVLLNADFVARDGLENQASFSVDAGRTVTLNGSGLANYGIITVDGTLNGDGLLSNYGYMSGAAMSLGGTGGFANYGTFAPVSLFNLTNTGAASNYGNIDVAAFGQLRFNEGDFTKSGSLNLNGGIVTGSAAVDNSFGGTISGRGVISNAFTNSGGVVLVENGTTNIVKNFTNSGAIQMNGTAANLAGGHITNAGTIEGYGNVGNNISNTSTIEAIGGTLMLRITQAGL